MKSRRIIGVVDADSFEICIYQRFPDFKYTKGKPCVLSRGQHSNRIVSVSREAKREGISRAMTVKEAKDTFPELIVIEKFKEYNKPESTHLRMASYSLRDAILEYFNPKRGSSSCRAPRSCFEKRKSNVITELNGSDEFFFDLTHAVQRMLNHGEIHNIDTQQKLRLECLHGRFSGKKVNQMQEDGFEWVGGDNDDEELEEEVKELAYGAEILQRLCNFLKDKTGYTCSAGVGENKVIAKIACKLHKPEAVTLLTQRGLDRVSQSFNFRDVPGLGGDLGDEISDNFGNDLSMADLKQMCTSYGSRDFTILRNQFSKDEIKKIRDLSRGICHSKVEHRMMNQYMNAGKSNLDLDGEDGLCKLQEVMDNLADETFYRIREERDWNNRRAKTLKFIYMFDDGEQRSRSFTLNGFKFGWSAVNIAQKAWKKAVEENTHRISREISLIFSVRFSVTEFC